MTAEPEIIPPGQEPRFEYQHAGDYARVRVAHVRSLGLIGAVLALLTMSAAVLFGLLMLSWRALFSALVVYAVWPFVFSAEFTLWVFGAQAVSFWKLFLLMVVLGTLAKVLRPAAWSRAAADK